MDAERTSGTSATDDELGHAVAKAADILAGLEERVPSASIGVGHRGNGASASGRDACSSCARPYSAAISSLRAGLEKKLGVGFALPAIKIYSCTRTLYRRG